MRLDHRAVFAVVLMLSAFSRVIHSTDDLESYCSGDPKVIRQLHIEAIKRYILLKLGLNEPPENPHTAEEPDNGSPDEDGEAGREYGALVIASDESDSKRKPCVTQLDNLAPELLVYFPTEITPYFWHEDSVDPGNTPNNAVSDTYRVKFTIDLRNRSTIKSAELRLYTFPQNVDVHPDEYDDRVLIILRRKPSARFFNETAVPLYITSQFVSPGSSGYLLFDIARALELWIEASGEELVGEMELEVRIKTPQVINMGHVYRPGIQLEVENNSKLIQLVISAAKGRERRQTDISTCASSTDAEPNCCLRPLSINFHDDLNWTWISHPTSAEVNYCDGLCPVFYGHSTEHRFFLSYMRAISARSNPTAAPQPCCVPSVMKPLHLRAQISNSNFTTVMLPNVITEGCVCQ